MIPSVDERLGSVIRALTDVVLPSLPPEAGLAQEQVQLALGHLQILRAQLDGTPGFEADELADATTLGEQLAGASGTADRAAMRGALASAAAATGPAAIRAARIELHTAMADLIATDGANGHTAALIIAAEKERVVTERAWFAPFGFDIAPPTA